MEEEAERIYKDERGVILDDEAAATRDAMYVHFWIIFFASGFFKAMHNDGLLNSYPACWYCQLQKSHTVSFIGVGH